MIRTIAALLIICFFATSVQAAQIHVEPSYVEVLTGENVTVDIFIDPEGSEVFGAQYELQFNTTLLNATAQTKGTFLSQNGTSTNVIKNDINNTVGLIKYGETRTGVDYGVTSQGILSTITFQAIAEEDGVSELRFEKVKLSDPNANLIETDATNGSISVRIGICGDVDGYPGVTTNDGWLIYMNLTFPGDPQYALTSTWAADCDGYPGVTTNDGWLIYMNLTFPGDPMYSLGCC